MDNDRWNHVDELLQSALDIPAVERDAYLRHACGGDQRLEEEVRSLSPHTTVPAGSSALRRSISPHASSPESAATTAVRPAAIR